MRTPTQSRTRSAQAGDGAGGGHVERVHASRHRDAHGEVDSRDGAPGQPVALGAEHEGEPLGRVRGQLVEPDRVVLERQRRHGEAQLVQLLHSPGPRVDPRPRHLEDRAHRHPDGAAVERVGAAGGDEHGIHAQSRGTAEHGADVGVVDDVLEHEHPPGALEHLREGRRHRPLHRRQRPAVQVEPGERLDDVVLADEHGDAVGLRPLDEVGEVGEPAVGHEVGPRPVPGRQRPADDLLGLGDVEPALGLGPATQRHVGEPDVVAQPRVGGVVDAGRHARKARPARRGR